MTDVTAAQDKAPRLTRAALADLRRAARQRWGVPDLMKTETLHQLLDLLSAHEISARTKLSAMRTLATFDQIDQADDRYALEQTKIQIRVTAQGPVAVEPMDPEAAAVGLRAALEFLEAKDAAAGGPR
jgi:hypothetical protein